MMADGLSPIISENWKDKFVKLICDIENCGFRATGLTLVELNGKIETTKHNTNATEFFKRENVKTLLEKDFQTMIGHCRFPTKGDVNFQVNNHPFAYGNTVIVHQGILNNDEELKKKYDFKPEGETDSWIIVHLIEKYRSEGKSMLDAIAQAHSELKGSWGVALVDVLEPEKVYLFCHEKSFKVIYFPEEEMFMFSTEANKLDKYTLDLQTHFDYFDEMRELRTAECTVKDEECLVLGGENEVEKWTLPEPVNWWGGKGKYKFGDGYGYSSKKDEEYWENWHKKDEHGGKKGRHAMHGNKVLALPEKVSVKIH
jgi:glutamine phosphoribosylpyrophosphate amidotransferase